jgi:hypothetical protein
VFDVANDADYLPGRHFEVEAEFLVEPDALSNGVALRPELPSHRFVD